MKTAKTLSWLVALAGLWEIFAPFFLGYKATGAALWDDILIGIALVVLASWAALTDVMDTIKGLSWVNVVLGVWLVVAPFILGYGHVAAAVWNDIIIGLVALVLSAWAASAVGSDVGHGQMHGGAA